MKFGQLIDYNMRIIFIEKWYTKCDGETSPRACLWINSLKFHTVFFLLYAKLLTIEIY